MAAADPDVPAPDDRRRTPLGVIFVTLFLDLVGFSIIFPLFPAILEHYADDPLLLGVVDLLRGAFSIEDPGDPRVQALFGGFLGSLYSLLQFLASPFWGRLSDRVGRRPVLSWTVAGIGVSYLLWAVSGSFALLVVSRLIAGTMAGNIATATAAVSDVTTRADRAKGMGFIGAAFGLGFILGPAIGGTLSGIDITEILPASERFGANPFTACALGAGVLSLLNWIWIRRRFAETYPEEKRRKAEPRPMFPRIGLGPRFGVAVSRVILGNFLLLLAFSGMEFTLAFLARDRYGWGPAGIAGMFVSIGLILAVVQGGLVRRLAPRFGERTLALAGLVLVAAGLGGIAAGTSLALFWTAITVLSVGSGLVLPTLSALVSLHAEEQVQGEVMGRFRSLGALARAIGPFAAALLYWRAGPEAPYWAGCAFLLLPLLLVARVPAPDHSETAPPNS